MAYLSKLTTLIFLVMLFPIGAYAEGAGTYDLNPCPSRWDADEGKESEHKWDLSVSPLAYHWKYSPEHKPVKLVSLDRLLANDRFCGLALFTNSFGQPSAYVYLGKHWPNLGGSNFYAALTGGFLYGYRGAHKKDIPLNRYGVAPVILPAIGYQFDKKHSAKIVVLAKAGVLFAYKYSF